MLDSVLRPVKDFLVVPLARLVERRVSPSAITVVSFIAGGVCAAFLLVDMVWAALAFWVVNRILDGLDGVVARRTGRVTDYGGYLDIVLDFVVYAAVPLAIAHGSARLAYPCALLLGATYVNGATWMYLAAILEKRGGGAAAAGRPTSVVMPAGIVEGTETIVLYTMMIVVPGWRATLFLIAAALILAGAALRFFQGLQVLRRDVPPPADRARGGGEGR